MLITFVLRCTIATLFFRFLLLSVLFKTSRKSSHRIPRATTHANNAPVKLNTMAVRSLRTGVIILMRNGSDRTVYINSGQEFDGSDSGAEPDEAVSWGKVKGNARAVKVCADATLVFPLIVARTFARAVTQRQKCRGERSEGGGEKGHQQHQQDNQRQLERID